MPMFKAILAAAFSLTALTAHAQGEEDIGRYPSKPIRIVIPFLPGGTTDGIARFIGQSLTEKWKQPVIVDAKPGAGGMIGANEVAKSKPDGYTLVMLVTGHMILPAIHKNMPYAMPGDFTPVSIISRSAKLILVSSSSPITSFRDLLARVKSDPAAFANYGTSGIGSEAHLSMKWINQLAGTRFVHVPYKGGVGPLSDLVDGRLPVGFLDAGSVLPYLKAGRLKPLAVSSSQRLALFPEVPAIREVLPEFEATGWYGIAGPRGMSPKIAEKLQQEIAIALHSPAAKAAFTDTLGWELPATTPQQMQDEMTVQTKKWADLARKVGMKPE